MTNEMKLPNLRSPALLPPAEWRRQIEAYQTWLLGELVRMGGNELRDEYIRIVTLIERMRAFGTTTLVSLQMLPESPWHELGKSLRDLARQVSAELIPLGGLIADYLTMKAEIADFALRSTRPTKLLSIPQDEAEELFAILAGLSSLQEVAGAYYSAADIYRTSIVQTVELLNDSEEDDPRRSVFAATWQYAESHLTAKTRALLMDLSFLLDKKGSDERVYAASSDEILPRVIDDPELMTGVVNPDKLVGTLWIIDYYKGKVFPEAHSVISFFNNLGILGMLMQDFAGARQALQIAQEHGFPRPPLQLVRNMQLLDLLDPRFRA